MISEKSYSTLIYGSFGVRMVLEGRIGSEVVSAGRGGGTAGYNLLNCAKF